MYDLLAQHEALQESKQGGREPSHPSQLKGHQLRHLLSHQIVSQELP